MAEVMTWAWVGWDIKVIHRKQKSFAGIPREAFLFFFALM